MSRIRLVSCLALALFSFAPALLADPAAIIAKARATIGSEAALTGLKSVHFVGALDTTDDSPSGPKPVKFGIEIIFQQPYQQRIVVTSDHNIETTCLDGYDGWQEQRDPKDPSNWRLTLLTKDQIKRLRANTWENLAFFKGIESRGGRLEEQGLVDVDGANCVKVSFIHEPGIVFVRYFNPDTGKLMLTETEAGGKIRESGEILAGGLRFPQKITTVNKLAEGKERVVTITFDKITVNESFPGSLFSIPLMLPTSKPTAAKAPKS
jgi:hypothetical protein